jgi:hypothetical protein
MPGIRQFRHLREVIIMAVARSYNVDCNVATGISIGTGGVLGTEYVLLYGQTASEFNVSAIRVGTYSGSSASYPSNGTITFRLRRASGTVTPIVVGTATAAPVSQSTTAAVSTWYFSTANGSGTGTFPTPAGVVWSQTVPCTAGANWGEWFTPGFEVNVGPGQGTLALTYELGAAGSTSAVNLLAELVISE